MYQQISKRYHELANIYDIDIMAQGKVLPQEKFYPEKKSTPEKVYPGKNPQFWSNQADIGET